VEDAVDLTLEMIFNKESGDEYDVVLYSMFTWVPKLSRLIWSRLSSNFKSSSVDLFNNCILLSRPILLLTSRRKTILAFFTGVDTLRLSCAME
jgi:hypothetical protein